MMRALASTALLVCLVCLPISLAAQAVPPRVGWEESFDDIARWKAALDKPESGTPPVAVESRDGCIAITTACGALDPKMKRSDWPEWPANPASSFTNFVVKYDADVDLDDYRYVVVRLREKSTFMLLAVNGKPTKVCYTTGIHAQDLRSLGLAGRQKVTLWGQFLNTSGGVLIDYIRLVRELTDEEKKGLIGEGLTIREENLAGKPYHGLDALNLRAGRPARTGNEGSEWCVFRDTATGAEVWKMTDLAANEYQVAFNSDGSAFSVQGRRSGGFDVFDWTTRKFVAVPGGLSDASPRFSTTEPDAMLVAENTWIKTDPPRQRRITIWRINFRTGERTEIAHFDPKSWIVQEWHSSPDSSKMVFGLRESPNVFLIDPSVPDLDKRVRQITLPTRLKGIGLINNDTELGWYNCYTYQTWIMDLATGKVGGGHCAFAGGHAAGGPHKTIGPYSDLMKIIAKNGLHPQTEATAEDVRIAANYARPVVTDYGRISSDGKWMVTDGTEGDVAGQHLMISTDDPAAVLRVCRHNTSRNDWVTNTYSYSSPDATKVAWVSDQLGNGDVYIAVTGRPPAPTELKAERLPDYSVKLTWKAPEGMREIAGYRVYRSTESGRGFVALNRAPIRDTTLTREVRGLTCYLVAAVEPSGIESRLSNETRIYRYQTLTVGPPPERRTGYVEAEEGQWKPPVRLVLDGGASGSRYLRYHRAAAEEPEKGSVQFKLDVPPGNAALWLRCRNENKDQKEWTWVRSGADPRNGVIEMTADGPSIDRIAIGDDPAFDPNKGDSLTLPPEPVKDLAAAEVTAQSVRLRWEASPTLNVVRYDVHALDVHVAELGNASIIGSTTDTQFMDWGLRPGSRHTYCVVAVDSRGNRSAPVQLSLTTAEQPVQTLTAKPEAGGAADRVTFALDVAAEAPFMLWAKYRPAYARDFRVKVEVDGKAAGTWTLRAPYRPMWWTLSAKGAGPAREFVDKISADGKDVFTLAPGRHTVTVVLDPKLADDPHAILEMTASNDHSFRPAGYDPRADFGKAK